MSNVVDQAITLMELRKVDPDVSYLDSGFFGIGRATAQRLSGKLPGPGKEKLVEINGKHYWLAATVNQGQRVWTLRATSWRLVEGVATLG